VLLKVIDDDRIILLKLLFGFAGGEYVLPYPSPSVSCDKNTLIYPGHFVVKITDSCRIFGGQKLGNWQNLSEYLEGKNLANHYWFAKFANILPLQNFPTYGIAKCADFVVFPWQWKFWPQICFNLQRHLNIASKCFWPQIIHFEGNLVQQWNFTLQIFRLYGN